MIRYLFLSFSLLCLLNCSSQKTAETNPSGSESNTQNSDKKNINLEQNKPQKIAKTNLTAKYVGITEDSRCPEGVTCVWQGLAIVEIEIKTATSKPQTIYISTMDFQPLKAQKTATIFGYNITLESIMPGKATEENNSNDKNYIEISVQKAD